ncbi:MAG: hypothetical protein M0R33_16660 [Methylomonas sp.]|jgi:hypothetical protein|uniref:hypothetical protein n=1 Tax=Methylomonas sp. TaxID=418 RepID=UPI0025F305DE|nr:hypothetical protein [Methylomonas sp.]MCK9608076.1 hypothetical protein [Methylomonas sp.]
MKRRTILIIGAPILLACSIGSASPKQLSPADEFAAFTAGDYVLKGRQWRSACGLEDTESASYTPGAIEDVRDINGDGHLDAVITEGGTFCYGNTGTGFSIVSQQPSGNWKLVISSQGIPEFLTTKGVDGWPDILIGGPGFCFPVMRWNGQEYKQHHFEYDGKSCNP